MPRWPGLDGLRALAVVAVVLFHVGLVRGGYVGVDVFFVLSGFLITRLLVAEHERGGRIALGAFYVRRVLRLYPALLAVVAFVAIASLAARDPVSDVAADTAASLTYVTNVVGTHSGMLGHTWTLALEEQFYLLWPLAVIALLGRRPRWALAAIAAGLAALLAVDLVHGQTGAAHTYVRAMGLPLGCVLGLASERTLTALGRAGWAALAGLAVVVVLPGPAALTTGWPISAGALLAAPVVALVVTQGPSVFAGRAAVWLGQRSYSLYLWHLPLILLVAFHLPGQLPHTARAAIGIALSVAAAAASYRWIERPALALRHRWAPRAPAVVEAPVAAVSPASP